MYTLFANVQEARACEVSSDFISLYMLQPWLCRCGTVVEALPQASYLHPG
jgi:hypothetical protein